MKRLLFEVRTTLCEATSHWWVVQGRGGDEEDTTHLGPHKHFPLPRPHLQPSLTKNREASTRHSVTRSQLSLVAGKWKGKGRLRQVGLFHYTTGNKLPLISHQSACMVLLTIGLCFSRWTPEIQIGFQPMLPRHHQLSKKATHWEQGKFERTSFQ